MTTYLTADATTITADTTLFTADGIYIPPPFPPQPIVYRDPTDYTPYITPWQAAGHPKFTGTVTATTLPIATAAVVTAALPSAFDIDAAFGAQLDVVGQWIGRDRYARIPRQANWFSLNDPRRGLGIGVWKGAYDLQFNTVALADETYRRLLYAKILANRWDGTIASAQAIFDTFFVDRASKIFVQDGSLTASPRPLFMLGPNGPGLDVGCITNGEPPGSDVDTLDLQMIVNVAGRIPSPTLLALLDQGALGIKPGGVEVIYNVTTVQGAPLFGLDLETDVVAGLGVGAIGQTTRQALSAL